MTWISQLALRSVLLARHRQVPHIRVSHAGGVGGLLPISMLCCAMHGWWYSWCTLLSLLCMTRGHT